MAGGGARSAPSGREALFPPRRRSGAAGAARPHSLSPVHAPLLAKAAIRLLGSECQGTEHNDVAPKNPFISPFRSLARSCADSTFEDSQLLLDPFACPHPSRLEQDTSEASFDPIAAAVALAWSRNVRLLRRRRDLVLGLSLVAPFSPVGHSATSTAAYTLPLRLCTPARAAAGEAAALTWQTAEHRSWSPLQAISTLRAEMTIVAGARRAPACSSRPRLTDPAGCPHACSG